MKRIKLALKRLLGFLIFTLAFWLLMFICMFFEQGGMYSADFYMIAIQSLKNVFILYGLEIVLLGFIALLVVGAGFMTKY